MNMPLNPYLSGPYAPIADERGPVPLKAIEGEIPRDLNGVYVRNGPNPKHRAEGQYHWFDGDGMLHSVLFEDGEATYRNRWIQTTHMARETDAGKALWRGLLESAARNPRDSPYKLTANTDVLSWNGRLYCLWYISGTPYAVDLETLETRGEETFGHEGLRTTAHAKVCSETGELIFFDYGFRAPFMRCGVVGVDGVVSNLVSIDLGGPRLPHDLAITRNYTILMDLPVLPDPEALKVGRWRTSFDGQRPARFGVIPRYGTADQIRWFEAAPCYVYHVVNAWEEGNKIVMTGCRCPDPIQAPRARDGKLGQMMANLRVTAHLHRWTFDLDTGQCHEEQLDDRNAEFPSVDLRRVGRRNDNGFTMALDIDSTLRFSGMVKYDLRTAAATEWEVGEGRFASEAPFAPRDGSTSDDDGYLVSLVRDANRASSELVVLDASDMRVVCRLEVPFDVPNGFHATWADASELQRSRAL